MSRQSVRIAPWVKLVREPSRYPVAAEAIRGPEDVARLLAPRMTEEEQEVFLLLCLNTQSRVTHVVEVTRGILNSSLVHPREVFAPAIVARAAGIIISHNHPSGDPIPSADDITITRQLVAVGELLDIPVYDHVVIGGHCPASDIPRYVSLSSTGQL